MKRLLSLILAMMLVCAAAAAETHVKEQGMYRYRVKEDGTAEITGVSESIQDGNIPAELDGYKVTSIGSFAFDECSNLKEVRIPEGVTAMLPDAFIRCKELTSVSIPDPMGACRLWPVRNWNPSRFPRTIRCICLLITH